MDLVTTTKKGRQEMDLVSTTKERKFQRSRVPGILGTRERGNANFYRNAGMRNANTVVHSI